MDDTVTLKTAAAVATAAAAIVVGWWRIVQMNSKSRKQEADHSIGTVTLYRLPPPIGSKYGDKSVSPPNLKVETFFRMCNIPHTGVFSSDAVKASKKGKLPICRVETGKVIEDSTFILKHFMEESSQYLKQVQDALCDKDLTPQQKALGVAIQSLCEDKLYFIMCYWRWGIGFSQYCQVFDLLASMPWPIRQLCARNVRNQLWQQGTGRHKPAEVEYLGQQAIDSIEVMLQSSETKFLFSDDKPSSYDSVLFSSLSAIVEFDIDSPHKQYTATKPAIQEYIKTINELYWKNDNSDAISK